MSPRVSPRTGIAIVATLCFAYVASQFYRSANAVIAPDLMRELGLSAESMGAITGAFFLTFAAVQIPCGILLDRFGPRRVMASLLLVAVVGSLLFAAADGGAGLAAGRGLMGIGCAAGLMGSMVTFARWFPADRFATLSSILFSVGGAGTLLATTPLAAASEAIGWRGVFVGAAAITVLMAGLIHAVVRDAPPGHAAQIRKPESPVEIFAGLGQVLATRQLWLINVMQLVAYPALITVVGLWAGPYLADVHGLDAVARGNVLLAMSIAVVTGTLAYGPLDRLLDTRKWLVVAGATVSILLLAVLALTPGLALWQATVLLVLFCFLGAYQMILHTHARAIFPEHLVGRGLTVQNMAAIGGVFVLQSASGLIIGAVSATGVAPELAYRLVFAFLGVCMLAALLVYLRIDDVRPSAAAGV